MAQCCEVWIDLLSHPDLEPHKSAVKKRFDKAILPCHLAAYLLHPAYKGAKLTEKQHDTAMAWLAEANPEYIGAAIAFATEAAPFPAYMFKATSLHPATWWLGMKRCGLPDGFVDLARALQSATASSASIERVFSTFSLIHNKLRNRLSPDTAAKLVFCFRMLRGKQELEY